MKKLVLSIAAAALLPALPASAQTAPAAAAATTTVAGAAKKAATKAVTNAARRAATRAVAPVVNKVTGAAKTATVATPAATTPAAPAATVPAATTPAVVTPATTATATSPVVAAAKALFNVDETSIGALLDNPAAKAVLNKYIPAMISNPQIDMARGMTLTQVQGFAGDLLNNETLAKIAADLAGIK